MSGQAGEHGADESATFTASGGWRDLSDVKCGKNGEKGHLRRSCPKPYGSREKVGREAGTVDTMKRWEAAYVMIGAAGGGKDVGEPREDEEAGNVGTNDNVTFCQLVEDTEPEEDGRLRDLQDDLSSDDAGSLSSTSYEEQPHDALPVASVGLNSQSTVELLYDSRMLKNIRKASRTKKL